MEYNPQYFTDNFNTKLDPQKEAAFQQWAQQQNRLGDLEDYDLRGFYNSNGEFANNGHGSDQFKKPNHPTFSDQSHYHMAPNPAGGNYVGGYWNETPQGQTSFTPSREMLLGAQPLNFLQGYMQKVEPDVQLNLDNRRSMINALRGK